MPEIRIDPLTGHRAIVAEVRVTRPGGELMLAPGWKTPGWKTPGWTTPGWTTPGWATDPTEDPFAEGREHLTPPELYAERPGGGPPDTPGWRVRVIPNLYPTLDRDGTVPGPSADPDLFWAGPARGAHEVIINAPHAATSLAELEPRQLALAVDVWRERMRAHADSACLHLIVNEGREAGASLPHTHAQLFALEFVPSAIARERERFGAYATRTMGGNLLADLVQQEVRRRERIVAIDGETVLMSPYGARLPYQLMIAPRIPRMRFEDDGPTGAAMLRDALLRLGRLLGGNPPLNLWVRTAPRGADHFCWRIDILPRLTNLAGLELGAGVNVNTVAPEQAAAELREA
jgi:UDPglucose--hexose-1-phosphate uridylyltransferase